MLSKTFSSALEGIDAVKIEVEVNATQRGEEERMSIVGLPDTAVRESRERVRSALAAGGFRHPAGFTLVNLAPADMKKEGAAFDLPIALGLIAAAGIVNPESLADTLSTGELALDSALRPVKGILPVALMARKLRENGIRKLIVPSANAKEASIAANDIKVYAASNLAEAVMAVKDELLPLAQTENLFTKENYDGITDFADVKGQNTAKRAIEIAAAGGHNLIMTGAPGCGKSLLAKCIPGILPPMTEEETLETSRIHSILGLLNAETPLLKTRPFCAPHHSVSDVGLIGGTADLRPGAISMAHNGVLFLDELPEFKRNVLEVLRQPLENGEVTICRATGSHTYPARFILVAAMNPCPCGHLGDRHHTCKCGANAIRNYRARISGPLLDRIDMHIEVAALGERELINAPTGESSANIRQRVAKARKIQLLRFGNESKIRCNAYMEPGQLHKYCELNQRQQTLLEHAIRQFGLSARAYSRILKVARTIADLDGRENIIENHILEAISYRSLDRRN